MWIYDFPFCSNSEKCRKYMFLGGSAQIITILHAGGVFPIYYNITMGDPKFVLRNIWTAPKMCFDSKLLSVKESNFDDKMDQNFHICLDRVS